MQERSIGPDAVKFCPKLELYLSPLSRIEINIKLPKFTIPGQSISNWDLMERLKKGVAPIQFSTIRVTESSLEGVTLEADLSCRKIMKQAIKVLESLTVKVSGFSDPVKVRAVEAKSDFPSRHDWDLFYMKSKFDGSKPGERPDTIYISKVPIKWFCEKGCELPSEELLKTAMETFGKVRMVDIPVCDELRKEMNPQISGIQVKGFAFGPEVFFEAYVQFFEYSGFVDAMESLRNMKWTKKIDGKLFHANVKVDFDRTHHLSAVNIKRREAERARINAEKRRIVEEEKRRMLANNNERAEKEAEARRVLEEKEMRREERERRRKEKYEAERLRKEAEKRKREEEERLAKEAAELLQKALEDRVMESRRFLTLIFAHIQRKEDRRIEVQEARLRAEQRAAELLDVPITDKEQYLRSMLLRQREIRIREKLKEKIRQAHNQELSNGSTPAQEENPSVRRSPSTSRSGKDTSPESNLLRKKYDTRDNVPDVVSKKHRHKNRVQSEEDSAEEIETKKLHKIKHRSKGRTSSTERKRRNRQRRDSSGKSSSDDSHETIRRRHRSTHKKHKKRKRSK